MRTEEQKEVKEFADLLRLDPALALLQGAKKCGEVDFKKGLKSRFARRDLSRHEAPEATVRQDAVVESTAEDVPLDLLRRVFAPSTHLRWFVERHVPGLRVCHDRCVLPKRRILPPRTKRELKLLLCREQGVVRFSA